VNFSYPDLGDFCEVAASILDTTPEQIAKFPNIGLAESALAAPRAGVGDTELYSTLLEKAAVLIERLARNHPLPDGNKRSAFLTTARFLEINGCPLRDESPDTDVPMVERIAAGQADNAEIVAWLSQRTAGTPERKSDGNA
jgi:death-on-curing protein